MARVLPPPRDLPSAIRIWGRTAPPGALAQLERIAAQPYVVGHVAAMLAPPTSPTGRSRDPDLAQKTVTGCDSRRPYRQLSAMS